MMKLSLTMTALVSFLGFAPLAYMLADNEPPYVYDVTRSYLVPARPIAKNQVSVHWHIAKVNRICPGTITRVIVNATSGVRTVYDPVAAVLPLDRVKSEINAIDRTFFLPPNLVPGLHYYKTVNAFRCNVLQNFWPLTVQTPEIPFEVVDR